MSRSLSFTLALPASALVFALGACSPTPDEEPNASASQVLQEGVVQQVGSVSIYEDDIQFLLDEWRLEHPDQSSRDKALQELIRRARITQAALDAELDHDPAVRAEIAKILASRHREKVLTAVIESQLKSISEPRLHERFNEQPDRFRSSEKRQVAVLWLDPGQDPARLNKYREKLEQARDWFLKSPNLIDDPTQGFSALSVDFSEHAATRFKGGKLGWLEKDGYSDRWKQAVAKLAFSLEDSGEVSAVVSVTEGVFLVRLMAVQPGISRSFESVRGRID